MEKTQIIKWIATILILVALVAIGFAISLFQSDSNEPIPFNGAVPGSAEVLPAKVDEDVAEEVRKELEAAPVNEANKEEVREELSKPLESGGLSEAEKERIRAELRK